MGGSESRLFNAVDRNDLSTVKEMLREHVNPNCRDSVQNYPMHYAMRCPDLQIASALIAHGARTNCKDERGKTPLHIAIEEKKVDFVRYLLTQSANEVNEPDNSFLLCHFY